MADPIHSTQADTAPSLLQRIHADWSRKGWSLDDLAVFRMEADDDDTGTDADDDKADDTKKDTTTDDKSAADDVEKWKALARKHEKEAKRLKAFEVEVNKSKDQSKSETEKAIEKAKAEAAAEAGKEATTKANARILRAEIKAAAAGKLADPADALRLLDLDDFDVDDDGETDAKAIAKAIDDLVKSKPYLAGKAGGKGSADNGARSGSASSNQALSPQERLRRAYSTK